MIAKKLMALAGALLLVLGCLALALPSILHGLGLHPSWDGARVELPGRRALIVTTSHGVLNAPGESSGPPTGVLGSEMTVPYYDFLDAGMQVDVASVDGGEIPIDPQSFRYMIRTPEDDRMLADPALLAKVRHSLRAEDLDFSAYDIVFFAGGWGAAYDFGQSDALGARVSEAYLGERTIIGSVCHGALALIRARGADGELLVAGRRMTGVTDKQVRELGIDLTPLHPEAELRKAGARFESRSAFRDFFATHVVTDDEERFVTGQNQNAGHETAHRMMALVAGRSS